MKTPTFFRAIALAVAATAVVAPMASLAGTTTGTLAVSATIANNCKFGTSTMAFGAYDPVNTNASTPLTATGSVGITCTSGDAVTLTANAGGNGTHASGACATATCTRAMFDGGTHYLSYDLYTTSGNTTVWNGTNSVAATGTGAAQTVNVYGYIPAAVADPAGSYTDSVTMTATF